jgi:hypothetical protein
MRKLLITTKPAPFQLSFPATNNKQGQKYNFPVAEHPVSHFTDLQ